MAETEITVQVFNNLDEIDKILKEKGFFISEKFTIKDWYFTKFNNIDGVSFHTLIDNSIILRENNGNHYEACLIHKNKSFDENGNVLNEIKTRVNVSDIDKTLTIFKMSKLNNYCYMKNESVIYTNGIIEFAIQNVDGLGIFLEYEENDDMKELPVAQKFNLLIEDAKKLGLKLGNDFFCKKLEMKIRNSNIV